MLRDKDGFTEQEFLQQYNPGNYPRPSVTVDMAVFSIGSSDTGNYRKLPRRELRLLLVRRGAHPYLDTWALPGGFVRPDETVGQAAHRELREETGVSDIYLEQLYTFSEPARDPRTWVISCAHMALIDEALVAVRGGDDAAEACWFGIRLTPVEGAPGTHRLELSGAEKALWAVVEELPATPEAPEAYRIVESEGLAFDHAKIITCALLRLRRKVEYTPIALHLLPERFTLTQLQQVYEVILGQPLLAAAFRRKVAPLVEETADFTQNAGHRPSRLFRRRINAQKEA